MWHQGRSHSKQRSFHKKYCEGKGSLAEKPKRLKGIGKRASKNNELE